MVRQFIWNLYAYNSDRKKNKIRKDTLNRAKVSPDYEKSTVKIKFFVNSPFYNLI